MASCLKRENCGQSSSRRRSPSCLAATSSSMATRRSSPSRRSRTGCVGDQLMQLAREPDGTWACLLPSFRSLQQVMTRKGNWPYNTGSANKDVNELFELLSDFHHDDCIMAASISAPSAGSDHFVDGRCVSGSLWSLLSERTASSTPISIHAFLCQHPSPTHLTSKQPV